MADTLVERLPTTLELLRAGQLTYLHAMKLAAAVTPVDDPTATKIEQRVLARAPEHNAGWQVKRLTGGSSKWTSPTGHTYARPPDG